MNTINQMLFKRRNGVMVEQRTNQVNPQSMTLALSASKNLESLNMCLSKDLITAIAKLPEKDAEKILQDILNEAQAKVGADHDYNPMYPGFPREVMNMDDARFYWNAIIYYTTGIMPYEHYFPQEDAKELIEQEVSRIDKLTPINLMTEKDIVDIYQNLLSSPVSLNPDAQKDIDTILHYNGLIAEDVKVKIPNKENLCFMAARSLENSSDASKERNQFLSQLRTPTDVARFISVVNGGDASLAGKIPLTIQHNQNKLNKLYARLFDESNHNEEDIQRREELFKRIFHRYHIAGLLKNPNMKKVADNLYHGQYTHKTFESKREQLFENKDYRKLMDLYKSNPGKLAADITRVARMVDSNPKTMDREQFISDFRSMLPKISVNAMLNAYKALEYYSTDHESHIYMANRGLSAMYIKETDNNNSIAKETTEPLTEAIKAELKERFSHLPSLGKVYIDPKMGGVKLPSSASLRTAAEGSVGMPYASRFDSKYKTAPEDLRGQKVMDASVTQDTPVRSNDSIVRGFIWWTNQEQRRVDVDLSCRFVLEDGRVEAVSYYDRRGAGVHSGDITDGGTYKGPGVCEFIDLNVDYMKERHVKYATFVVNSYTQQNFKDIPCNFGWLEGRAHEMPGYTAKGHGGPSQFDAQKVTTAFPLKTNATMCIPVAYDVQHEQFVWIDRGIDTRVRINNVRSNDIALAAETERAVSDQTMTLKEFAEIHTEARGEIVTEIENADVVFSFDRIDTSEHPEQIVITPTDLDMIGALMNDTPVEEHADITPAEISNDNIDMDYDEER